MTELRRFSRVQYYHVYEPLYGRKKGKIVIIHNLIEPCFVYDINECSRRNTAGECKHDLTYIKLNTNAAQNRLCLSGRGSSCS